jgi:uncharacterized SAM-binding protein YcdF (DUF218 family)
MTKKARGLIVGGVTALLFLFAGCIVLAVGGRPMLFGALVCWGMAAVIALLTAASVLPRAQGVVLFRSIIGLVLVGCLFFGGLEAVVLANCKSNVTGEPQVMVILGANLWDHEPSPVLEARLDTALEYLQEHPNMPVVVTGGMGDDEPISEASCMAFYLETRGIDEERIIQEDKAANTMQNLKFTKELLEKQGYATDNLLVVSSSFHLARAKMLAKRNDLTISTLSAPVPGGIAYHTYFCLREGAALVKSWIFDRG